MSLYVDIRKKLDSFTLDVSFSAENGVMGVLGASGSGKSMALKCIAGIETPDEGRIVLNGRTLFDSENRINLKPQQRRVGYLFQSYALFPNMTVKRNVLCALRGIRDKKERERLADEKIGMMRLNGLEGRYPHELSGGEQQRTALARILASSPELLMLDEPFSALDAYLKEKLMVELKCILKDFDGVSIAVTHDRDEAYDLCDTIGIIDNGKMLSHLPKKALFADSESIAGARLTGCKNIAAAFKTGEYEVFVPEWGISLLTARPVPEDIKAVGVRAHYYSVKSSKNRYPVRITGLTEEPFKDIIRFRYISQSAESQDIWWRGPKEQRPSSEELEIGISPVNVMMLTK